MHGEMQRGVTNISCFRVCVSHPTETHLDQADIHNQAWRLGNLGNQTKSGTKLGDLLDNAHSLLFNVTGKYTIFHEYYAWDNKFIWEKHLLEQKTSASVDIQSIRKCEY